MVALVLRLFQVPLELGAQEVVVMEQTPTLSVVLEL